jgi:hypothetical protein
MSCGVISSSEYGNEISDYEALLDFIDVDGQVLHTKEEIKENYLNRAPVTTLHN